jgi:hypothetical protein
VMRNTRCFTLISTLAGGDSGAESSLEEELYFSQSGSSSVYTDRQEELAPADLKGGALGLREDAGAEGASSVAGWVAPSPWGGGGGGAHGSPYTANLCSLIRVSSPGECSLQTRLHDTMAVSISRAL